MKNKIILKKHLILIGIITIISLICFILLNIYEYHKYTINFNNKIASIVEYISTKYPSLNKEEIMEIINNEDIKDSHIFDKYGIDISDESLIIINDKISLKFIFINCLFLITLIIVLLFIFTKYHKRQEKEINNITKYIEEINKNNYSLSIDSISEDELSILKNEIYKTTIKLKEACNNSAIDKINLKNSLEDISHQLKTPLTSILIMLDNLIDDSKMSPEVRYEFIMDIKRNIININFLVQAILKLSKFDSNTINFIKKNNSLKEIVDESIKNVSMLSDLRNVEIVVEEISNSNILCDLKWQIEAITNILKNSIDHSKDGSKVLIKYQDYNVYSLVEITDFGDGISKKDLPHIFERFYKGENASSDSIGIGLALSKKIINEDNGTISVESSNNKTKFIIKYFKL